MTLAKAKAKTNETFIVQASLMIVTYDCQNMFIVQATGVNVIKHFSFITVFVLAITFQSSLIFVGNTRSLLKKEESERCANWVCSGLALKS
jgi:hypothetical protein